MRAIVTGACGFAGKHLIRHLLGSGDEVTGTFFADRPALPGCAVAQLDVRDAEACRKVIAEHRPEAVYHLAGVAFAPDCERDFNASLVSSVGGTFNILRACEESGRQIKVLVLSSGEVYGLVRPEDLPLTEAHPVRPHHSYSLTKAMVELAVQSFSAARNLRLVTIRAFNHIGPGQRVDFVVSSFACQLARIAAGKAEPVVRVGNLVARRDFSHVSDVVRGYRLAMLKGEGVYNLCSGTAVQIREVLDLLIEVSGLKIEVVIDPSRVRPVEVPVLQGSYKKAKGELGWEPERTDLRASLREVYHDWLVRERAAPS